MPLPRNSRGSEQLLTYWNRFQNRYKYKDAGLLFQDPPGLETQLKSLGPYAKPWINEGKSRLNRKK